jgi:hypothetical protein
VVTTVIRSVLPLLAVCLAAAGCSDPDTQRLKETTVGFDRQVRVT